MGSFRFFIGLYKQTIVPITREKIKFTQLKLIFKLRDVKNLPNLNGRADLRNLKTETKRLLFMSFCFFFISELGVGNVLIANVVYESRTVSHFHFCMGGYLAGVAGVCFLLGLILLYWCFFISRCCWAGWHQVFCLLALSILKNYKIN